MLKRAALTGLLAALLVGTSAQAAPLEVYGRLPQIEDADISADGSMYAMVVTDGEHRNVVIRRVGETQPIATLAVGDAKLRELRWAGSNHVLITASVTSTIEGVISDRSEWWNAVDFNVATRHGQSLFRIGPDHTLNVLALGPYVVSPPDGRITAIVGGIAFPPEGGQGLLSLFRTPLDGARTEVTEMGLRDTRDYVVDETGRAVAALEVTESGRWTIRVRAPGARDWRQAADGPDTETPNLLGLGRDGRTVVVAGEEADAYRLREISLETGAWSEPLDQGSYRNALFNQHTMRLSGIGSLDGDTYSRRYFDPRDQSWWNSISHAFPGQRVTSVSTTTDGRRSIALVDSPADGPAYALVDFNTGRATWIGNVYRGLTPDDVSPTRYITYEAGDGLQIGAYLTLPRGREARGLPLVVLPHGGPQARDDGGFDWWAQALASRGYAVLQPQFRGSAGYGPAFVHAGYGQWGRRMQTDLSDGVTVLARQGTIDPARVCIVGASYGGYAALAGVTVQHGVYRCAASVGGVSDPGGLIGYSSDRQGAAARRYWNEFMGVAGRGDPRLAEISPLAHAATADAPILLIHGRDDTVVPFSQTAAMQGALLRAGRPVEVVPLPGEDHWLSRGATRLQMLTAVVQFLERHNPPGATPAAGAAAAPAQH